MAKKKREGMEMLSVYAAVFSWHTPFRSLHRSFFLLYIIYLGLPRSPIRHFSTEKKRH